MSTTVEIDTYLGGVHVQGEVMVTKVDPHGWQPIGGMRYEVREGDRLIGEVTKEHVKERRMGTGRIVPVRRTVASWEWRYEVDGAVVHKPRLAVLAKAVELDIHHVRASTVGQETRQGALKNLLRAVRKLDGWAAEYADVIAKAEAAMQ